MNSTAIRFLIGCLLLTFAIPTGAIAQENGIDREAKIQSARKFLHAALNECTTINNQGSRTKTSASQYMAGIWIREEYYDSHEGKTIEYHSKAQFSALSPKVSVVGNRIGVECTSGSCFTIIKVLGTEYRAKKLRPIRDNSSTRFAQQNSLNEPQELSRI